MNIIRYLSLRIFNHSFQRFIGVGLSNTLISYIVFIAAFHFFPDFSLKTVLSQTLSYSAGIVWSYYWNRKWVFRSNNQLGHESSRFMISQIVMLLLSVALLAITVDFLKWPATLSWVGSMGLVTITNYLILQQWVFEAAK